MKKTDDKKCFPVVVLANNYQFAENEKLIQPSIESRMLLWCRTGCGYVVVNGKRFPMTVDAFLLLPWRRRLEYHPDRKTPFMVAGIHFIPHHAKNHKVEFDVAHSPSHHLYGKSWRADALPDELPEFLAGSFEWNLSLKHLAEYIVADFEHIKENVKLAELAAKMLCTKLQQTGSQCFHEASIPLQLKQILEYLRHHMESKISIDNMADIAQCSPSTVMRLFQHHLNVTPIQWLLQFRIDQAAKLLATTRLSIGEIGRRVGVDDPYYFSKFFKKITGKTAREYRSKQIPI